jgi:3-oxoadipate enol-lactonase
VLLHSIATSSAMWSPQVDVWSRLFRVINIDLPGHGATPPHTERTSFADLAAGVCAVLDAHDVDQASIVGLSLGGMIAQALLIHHRDRVRSAVLAYTVAEISPAVRDIWDQRIAAVEQTGMADQVETTIERWFTPEFRATAPMTVAWIAQLIATTSPLGFIAAARAIQALDHLGALAAYAQPALVIAGRHDAGAPRQAAQAMAETLPNAEFQMLESAHLGNVEQAIPFTETVGRFLARTA